MTQDSIQLQTNEFMALSNLCHAYNCLPAVVDDDYPEQRHMYEGKLKLFIQALRENGRL